MKLLAGKHGQGQSVARKGRGGHLRRVARRLRQSLAGERDDLGHLKHLQRWLMGQFAR